MRAYDIIQKKRDGKELSFKELSFFIEGFCKKGSIPDYQITALLMAIFLQGMTFDETYALTKIMMESGVVLDFSDLPQYKVDKHSTGGVGDKTSFIIAPILAAAGAVVPMISGRGLGHTGGTLDKLESIPGFNVHLSLDKFKANLKKAGLAIIGQTAEITPADKKLYALRDVTATVESIPLITASIMSKKLAEGLDGLVLDVKVGKGAFMKTEEDAALLAGNLLNVGKKMGKDAIALLTDMNQPLGKYVGHSLEIKESVDVLKGEGPEDLIEICLNLSSQMLKLAKIVKTEKEGIAKAQEMICSSKALEKFRQMVELQGGDPKIIDEPKRLPLAKNKLIIKAQKKGYLEQLDAIKVGLSIVYLGGGREKADDRIDHGVGIVVHKKIGDKVEKGEEIFTVYYNKETRLKMVEEELKNAISLSQERVSPLPLIRNILK